FARHCGTVVLPTRPRHPEHKGKVERGVGYVKGNGLKGRVFGSWINRRVGSCLLAGAEPTEDGYAWRLGFRGRVNDYTRFDISKHDVFGLYFIFADCESGQVRHYPVFGQLHGPQRELRINPELRLNQTAVFDIKGVIPGDEVTTVGVFGL
ncbi:MAG: hypothetical protein PHV28_09840, partial [Kiritimatiellae bacterium]|nr:hypothetical protein [Kiritimatiellia bacterium]